MFGAIVPDRRFARSHRVGFDFGQMASERPSKA
jgi:hypothetical protein